MKMACKTDGIHFPKDFKITLKPPCNFWGDMGLSNLPINYKKKLWDWMFAMPADEIGIKFKIGLAFTLQGIGIPDDKKFENLVPGYSTWDEKKQQEFQKEYYLGKVNLEDYGMKNKVSEKLTN